MKKNTILILLYLAVSVSNISEAYFYADTNSIAPVAYYAEDSLPKRIGHLINPISLISVLSSITAPIFLGIGAAGTGYGLGFDPLSLGFTLFALGIVCGIIGLVIRKKLMSGKYVNYHEPKKLPLGQGRSWIGITISAIVLVLVVIAISLGV